MIVRDGTPVFLESNVAPGLTDTSLAPLALEAAGLNLGEVFAALVERARNRGK
jgi:D-alanine--D-alanine ligase 2